MRVNFYDNLNYYKSIKLNRTPNDLKTESSKINTDGNNSSNYDKPAAVLELQSRNYDINTIEKQIAEIQASVNEWEEKSANIKESYLKDFTSTFYNASSDNDVMTDMLNKYNEIKSDILDGDYADIEKSYRLKYLDKSYGTAVRLLENKIKFEYYKEQNKNNTQNKSDEDITNFVQNFSKDVGDSLIALKNSENDNYTSTRLNMNADTLSKLLESFFKNPASLKNYYLDYRTQK